MDTSLNIDTLDHMVAYQGNNIDKINIFPFGPGIWTSSEYILAFEDTISSVSDLDYTDMVVMVESVSPSPEPTTLVLFCVGLFSLLGIYRKRFKF